MQVNYYNAWSGWLNRNMEIKVYGYAGRPVLVFPCQSGRFFDWENEGMVETAAWWIERGEMQLFCCDSIDPESWDCPHGDPRYRIEMHEKWYNYVTQELYPRMMEINGGGNWGRVITTGSSMGASHALNFFLRRPDLYNGVIALSGLYTMEMFFGDYMDDLLYQNVPEVYMKNLPNDHYYIDMYNRADPLLLCVGQGDWETEMIASTHAMQEIFASKGINAQIEFWGHDVAHDWPWWRIQWPMFLGRVFE
ncbi:MAG: esterase family protein [Oscillospiraceae bacterium]|nr:esterase family protein [Oscillospiraceae bacterium]